MGYYFYDKVAMGRIQMIDTALLLRNGDLIYGRLC